MIESVLKIVNAPTKTATNPNTISTILMMLMNIFRPSSPKRSCAAALWTWRELPSAEAIADRRAAELVPSLPMARIES